LLPNINENKINKQTPTKDMLRKTIGQKGLNTTRSVYSLSKNDSLPNLPKIHKGNTKNLSSANSTRNILLSQKWDEMNLAFDKSKNTYDNNNIEIENLKEKTDEKDHIIKRLMEELKNDEVFLNKNF